MKNQLPALKSGNRRPDPNANLSSPAPRGETEVATGMMRLDGVASDLMAAIDQLENKAAPALRPHERDDSNCAAAPIQALSPLGSQLEYLAIRLAAASSRLRLLTELLEL